MDLRDLAGPFSLGRRILLYLRLHVFWLHIRRIGKNDYCDRYAIMGFLGSVHTVDQRYPRQLLVCVNTN